jgi:hypothetical protein
MQGGGIPPNPILKPTPMRRRPGTRHIPAEIAPELTGHGLPLGKCEAYNRVYDQFYQSR